MTAREFDPLRLDVAVFARLGATLQGEWPLVDLRRVVDAAHPHARPTQGSAATWSARGELRQVRGATAQIWLHLRARTAVQLECQRCLAPVEQILEVEQSFMFVVGEDAAAAIDVDSEHDVLAMTQALDLRELIEDELLLALPLVPRHEVCPEPLSAPPQTIDPGLEKESPFAALKALKRNGRSVI